MNKHKMSKLFFTIGNQNNPQFGKGLKIFELLKKLHEKKEKKKKDVAYKCSGNSFDICVSRFNIIIWSVALLLYMITVIQMMVLIG